MENNNNNTLIQDKIGNIFNNNERDIIEKDDVSEEVIANSQFNEVVKEHNDKEHNDNEHDISNIEKEKEKFAEENTNTLSTCNPLREIEIRYKQTIEINPSEKDDPNIFIKHLERIKDKTGLQLDIGSSANFFLPTKADKKSFEETLEHTYENRVFSKSLERAYHFLVLLNRKTMHYSFENLNRTYNFDLRDIYNCNGIKPAMFNSINEIPSNIVKRCKASYEKNQFNTRAFVRKINITINQINSKKAEMQNVASNSDGKDVQSEINNINNQIKKLEYELENISFEIEDALYKGSKIETPTPTEVIHFISDFVCYGLNVTSDVIKNDKRNNITENEKGVKFTKNKDIIRGLEPKDLYFQDTINLVWLHAKDVIHAYTKHLAPTLRVNNSDLDIILDDLTTDIKLKEKVNVFSFKENVLFFKNGMIEIDYKKDGTLNHQFTHNNVRELHQIMFGYPTKLRLDVKYNNDVDYTFKDNPDNIPVTPDYIFGALGRRGFEVSDDMNDETKDELKNEASDRANLLMQYSLNILLPYNELSALENGYFLYFYNAEHSGKSTFMELMNNMVGERNTANLKAKDLSSQESFGLVNAKGKRLVLVDEATNGKDKIDTEDIKKMTTKSHVETNAKNREYESFKFENELILASNYEPTFIDESGGTERRLLAFQLETGYKDDGGKINIKPLNFIQNDLIKRDDFKSACIKWALENVNATKPIPKSIKTDANRLISKEDDVRTFMEDRLQETIDEPFAIYPDDLYTLYTIENLAKGRNIAKIRNKQNFFKAIDKMTDGVYLVKEATHSKVDILNRLVALEGQLFHDIINAQHNQQLENTLIREFMELMKRRKKELQEFYNGYSLVAKGDKKLSNVSVTKRKIYVIYPSDYGKDVRHSSQDLRNCILSYKNKMLNETNGSERNRKLIREGNYSQLPPSLNIDMSKRFNSYTTDNNVDRTNFNEFTDYK